MLRYALIAAGVIASAVTAYFTQRKICNARQGPVEAPEPRLFQPGLRMKKPRRAKASKPLDNGLANFGSEI